MLLYSYSLRSAYKTIRLIQFLLISTVLISHSAVSEQHHWQSNNYIIDSFIDIALGNEYTSTTSILRKWSHPISYQIIHRTGDEHLHEALTQTHLAHLADITGLTITQTTNQTEANLKIIFSSELNLQHELQNDFLVDNKQLLKTLSHNGVCLANFSIDDKGNITKAIVLIPVDRARAHAKLLSCIVEELTQIMGLPNDSDKVFPSIFNDKSTDDYLSGLDFILLKALYHPSLLAGMHTGQVQQQLKQLLASKEFQTLISNAELEVKKQGLYSLLN